MTLAKYASSTNIYWESQGAASRTKAPGEFRWEWDLMFPWSKVIGSTNLPGGSLSPPLAMPQKEGYKAPFVQAAPVHIPALKEPKHIIQKHSHPDSIAIAGFHTKGNNQKIKLRF